MAPVANGHNGHNGHAHEVAAGPGLVRNALAAAEPITAPCDAQAEIARLAALDRIEYDREREPAAKRLGCRVATLDDRVKAARGPADSTGQGRAFQIADIEPWPEPVDGAALLDGIVTAIRRHTILPSGAYEVAALWAVHTHCFDAFMVTPRLAIRSPEKGCGKTTLLDVLERLVARPLPACHATSAVVFRVVEISKPTLLIDEADSFLQDNEELRGILNSGHRRGGSVLRVEGENHEPRKFATHSPLAIALIGRLPDTLEDRSVTINLRRRKATESIERFRSDRVPYLTELAHKAARWCADNVARLQETDPEMGELFNRVADNWRPLFAIADIADGGWPARVREIASASVVASNEQSIRVHLLADVRWILDGQPEADENGEVRPKHERLEQIPSVDLASHLLKIEGRPWAEWKGGKPITPGQLARQLGQFQIHSRTIWSREDGGERTSLKGYTRADFAESFERYLPSTPSENVTTSQPYSRGHCDAFENVTGKKGVTFSKTSQPYSHGHCDAVTFSKGGAGDLSEEIEL